MSGVHDYLATLSPAAVLCIGRDELGHVWPIEPCIADDTGMQLNRRFDVVVIARCEPGEQWTATLHAAMLHLERGGHLVVNGVVDGLPDLEPVVADDTTSVFRRGPRFTVHDLLHEARSQIRRVTAAELCERLRGDDPPLVVDTRTPTDRARFGTIPDSVHVPRTVVEWHFDPANGYLHRAMRSFDQPLVVVCNSGYSSSLSAANLVRIGFTDVADLVGGFEAWRTAGLPIDSPDHSHLDTPHSTRQDST